MRMTTYLVSDEATGEVVHVHIEPAGLDTQHEEILHHAGRRGDTRLVVTELPGGWPCGVAARLEGGTVREHGQAESFGGGGGGTPFGEPAGPRRFESP